jgi:hypothetical protein
MSGFTKLFSSILTSSVWVEDNSILRVWIALLALCDSNGVAEGAVPGLASLCRMSVDETQTALAKLSAPDPYSRTPEYEGRRIAPVDGGWLIINYLKYREKGQLKEGSRAKYMREYMREYRHPESTDVNTGKPNVNPRLLPITQRQKQKQKQNDVSAAPVDEQPASLPAGDPHGAPGELEALHDECERELAETARVTGIPPDELLSLASKTPDDKSILNIRSCNRVRWLRTIASRLRERRALFGAEQRAHSPPPARRQTASEVTRSAMQEILAEEEQRARSRDVREGAAVDLGAVGPGDDERKIRRVLPGPR